MLGSRTGKRGAKQQTVRLQQQMVPAVNIHQQLLEVKNAKLELKREEVMKKLKLMTKGWVQDSDGNWVGTVKSGEE